MIPCSVNCLLIKSLAIAEACTRTHRPSVTYSRDKRDNNRGRGEKKRLMTRPARELLLRVVSTSTVHGRRTVSGGRRHMRTWPWHFGRPAIPRARAPRVVGVRVVGVARSAAACLNDTPPRAQDRPAPIHDQGAVLPEFGELYLSNYTYHHHHLHLLAVIEYIDILPPSQKN